MCIKPLYNAIIGTVGLAFLLTACQQKPLFEQVAAEDSGIAFANRITEKDTLNIL